MSAVADEAVHEAYPRDEAAGPWRVERLESAQQDLYRLLEFATEHGPRINKEVIRQTVDIGRVKPCQMTEEQEEILWRTRSTLSEVVHPAHASGLRLMGVLEAETPATGEPRTLRGWSGRWLLFALLGVATAHAYAVVGGRLISDAGDTLHEAEGVEQILDSAATDASVLPEPLANSPGLPGPSGPGENSVAPAARRPTINEIEALRLRLDYQRERLTTWNRVWRLAVFPLITSWAPPSGAAASIELATTASRSELSGAKTHRARARFRAFVHGALLPLEAERYVADRANSTMMEYVLPMLYGALGAFIFVVRRVTSDIDRGSLKILLRMRYRSRLLLGAIFGLTMAMLATESSPFMKQVPLSTVALAFLAGYGIDAAFGLLDAVIGRVRRMGLDDVASGGRVGSAAPIKGGAPARR